MEDVLNDDDKTLDKSNSGEVDDQTTNSDDTQVDDQTAGNAAGDDSTKDGAGAGDAEAKQTRGERRHDRYIDRLSSEIRSANDQSTRRTDDLFTPGKPYQPMEFKDGEEYDAKQLEEDRKTVAANQFAQGIQQGLNQGTSEVKKELWADRFEIDSERVTSKYKELDPDADNANYNPDLEAHLVKQYIAFIGLEKDAHGRVNIQKPNIRFKDFVEAEMANLEKFAAAKGAASSRNVASQAAKTGMRPNGQSRSSTGTHGFDPNDPVNSVKRMTSEQYFKLGGKEASDAYLAERGLAPKQ